MKKKAILSIIIFISFYILFFGYLSISNRINRQKNLSYEFNDVIQRVVYDVKGVPTVTIKQTEYCLSAGYDFNRNIEKGDSLKKSAGSSIYVLVKRKTGQTFRYNNYSY